MSSVIIQLSRDLPKLHKRRSSRLAASNSNVLQSKIAIFIDGIWCAGEREIYT